ncbi:TylF/MycF/NovP-related O-methyltransferase [Streptomyces sp. NPDC048420]|uniref:TylF/MycF/NovP-related O-methyltransferase n=1 Tax=Streptomyces sp. NPDC048420 TaxID=3155755 RepID=UPI0034429D57
MSNVKTATRNALDRVLRIADARVITQREELVTQRQYARVVQNLYDIHIEHVFPALREREGRLPLISKLIGTEISEAMHLLHWLQNAQDSGEGDVVEMGVAQGSTSALLANEIMNSGRHLWLYDSFQGLSRPTAEDRLIDDIEGRGTMHSYESAMSFPQDLVRKRLTSVGFPFDRLHIVAGFIAEELRDLPDVVAFAYLDFDLYKPILTGLRLLGSRTRPGSILMVDDYGYFSSGPEQAVRDFLAEDDRFDLVVGPRNAGHFCALLRR